MKVISFDFEMSNLNADFGIILCGCFLTWDSNKRTKMITHRIDDSSTYKREPWNDRELCIKLRDELETADIIVGWNSKRFDIPYLNGRLLYWGERTMNRCKHIDLMYQARYKMRLHSSRLASVQAFLGLEDEKTEMKPQIWVKAITGHRKSMDYIVDHCVKDVKVLDQAFDRLKHFVQVIYP